MKDSNSMPSMILNQVCSVEHARNHSALWSWSRVALFLLFLLFYKGSTCETRDTYAKHCDLTKHVASNMDVTTSRCEGDHLLRVSIYFLFYYEGFAWNIRNLCDTCDLTKYVASNTDVTTSCCGADQILHSPFFSVRKALHARSGICARHWA